MCDGCFQKPFQHQVLVIQPFFTVQVETMLCNGLRDSRIELKASHGHCLLRLFLTDFSFFHRITEFFWLEKTSRIVDLTSP